MATWDRYAACATVDPELFFPDSGDTDTATAAKQICGRCPVRELCLAEALTSEGSKKPSSRFGIRGGLDPDERYRQATGRGVKTGRRPAECGTDAAYRRHLRNGETIDEPCGEAHRQFALNHYHQKKTRAGAVAR